MAVRYYGAKVDTWDYRDYKKEYSRREIPQFDVHDSYRTHECYLYKYVDHVYDQGQLGSCTANALCAAYGLDLKKQEETSHRGYVYFDPSRLFLYYNARDYEGTTQKDSGASIRDAVKALNRKGVCKEEDWPYYIYKYKQKPTHQAFQSAQGNNLCKYERLQQNVDQLRACINEQCPFVFGFKVYNTCIEKAGRKETMSPPEWRERHRPDGRHAVVAVGYSDRRKAFLILNSWGSSWGNAGYFFMSYDFIKDSDLCFDFWKISFACQRGKPRPKDTQTWQDLATAGGSGGISYGGGACGYSGGGAGYRYRY